MAIKAVLHHSLTSSGSKWPMLAADLVAFGSELSARLKPPPSSLDGRNLRQTTLEQEAHTPCV
jgi:hypothetical protein